MKKSRPECLLSSQCKLRNQILLLSLRNRQIRWLMRRRRRRRRRSENGTFEPIRSADPTCNHRECGRRRCGIVGSTRRIGPASLVFSNVCCNNFHNILPFSDWITGQLWEELGDAHLSVSIIVCRIHFVVGV